jgi:hypothetical protein
VVCYAYCIVPAGRTPRAGLAGVAGGAVTAIDAGSLCCWVSTLDEAPGTAVDVIRSHNAVVVAAMDRDITPVPLRFGQFFQDRGAVVAGIAARSTEWHDLLGRFAGRAEYGVRIARAGPEAARDVHAAAYPSGTAYMAELARRQAAEARREEDGARIAARLAERAGPLIADARVEPAVGARGVVTIAHLVAWDDADAYHAALQHVRSETESLRFLFTGPWPPYSFVT